MRKAVIELLYAKDKKTPSKIFSSQEWAIRLTVIHCQVEMLISTWFKTDLNNLLSKKYVLVI